MESRGAVSLKEVIEKPFSSVEIDRFSIMLKVKALDRLHRSVQALAEITKGACSGSIEFPK